jgi:signal transduction histidine kinase
LRADLRGRPLRLMAAAAVLAAGIIELQSLGQALRDAARQREGVLQTIGSSFRAVRKDVGVMMQFEPPPWRDALDLAIRATLALEADVFDTSGRHLGAYPARAPVAHWPRPADVAGLLEERTLLVGPLGDSEPRMLFYAAVPGPNQGTVILRLALPGWELLEDIRARRLYLLGHTATLLALLMAGVMAVFPARDLQAGAPPRVLDAYHAALERLRDQGQAEVRRHQTERQRLEEEMRDREAMVRAGELTAGMVHEVRNGLNTILGYARLLEGQVASKEAAEAAGRIRDECGELETLVRRFMDFIKRDTLRLETVPLARMLARVASREAQGADRAHIVVREGPEIDLLADEDLLERAFENLVRNARQAAGARGHVWIDWRAEGDGAVVVVSDDGPGMPAGVRATLRPFFTTKAGGLGLGLATAVKIVRLHGGDLFLGDRSPHGLTATVRLPRSATAQPLPSVANQGAAANRPD